MWIVFAVVAAMLIWGGYALVRAVMRERARGLAVAAEVEQEMGALYLLEPDEAYARAETVIQSEAVTQRWGSPIPPAIEARLGELDSGLANLLRRFRRIRFRKGESPMELSAEFFSSRERVPEGHVIFGMSDDRHWIMCARPGDASAYEVIEGLVREAYPTAAHYIVVTQHQV